MTRFDTGQRCSKSFGAGLRYSTPASPLSHGSNCSCVRNAGIRSWIFAANSFGSVMIIVQELSRSPVLRSFNSSQSPAAVRSGEPSRAVKYHGCFRHRDESPRRWHADPRTAGARSMSSWSIPSRSCLGPCSAEGARTAGEVYDRLGCSVQCGRCARTIRQILNEALAHFASRAAFRFPSPAETIDPFINICHACANFSGSSSFASSARLRTIARIFARCIAAARRTGLSTFAGKRNFQGRDKEAARPA